MNLIFDVILAAIMASIIFISYKKGFVASVLSLASVIVSTIVTYLFYKPVAAFINDNFMFSGIYEFVRNKVSDMSENGDVESLFLNMPEEFKNFLSRLSISAESIKEGFENSGLSATNYADSMASDIATTISYTLSCAIAILIIFIAASIICAIASLIINAFFKLPILKTANKLLGLAVGVVCAVLVAWVLSNASVMILEMLSALYPESFDSNILGDSYIINFFSTFNPIQLLKKLN